MTMRMQTSNGKKLRIHTWIKMIIPMTFSLIKMTTMRNLAHKISLSEVEYFEQKLMLRNSTSH